MKVLRVRRGDQTFYGQLLLEENAVLCLDRTLGFTEPIPLTELAVLPPVSPSKVVCVDANFQDRLRELGRKASDAPLLFFKPPSAIIGSGQSIVLPRMSAKVEALCALAIILGRPCRNIAAGDVPRHLFGYACANDVTASDLRERDESFGRAKSYDTFAPIGPWIETTVADPSALVLRTRVNGQLVQEGAAADMAYSPFDLVSFVSQVMTLLPGDVILTGSPAGGGQLSPGDEVRVEIDEVGVLINPIRAEAEAAPLQ
jgi:2-keto-4-pentenoate hydratase/2-oxohepta-3-ene-1,7-dioic acid hydratase in catechol pathway